MGRAGQLWTPDGMVGTAPKDTILINQKELILLGHLHEFAHKHGITIYCKSCEQPISGQNNDTTQRPSVACQCREWVYSSSAK